MEYYWESKKEWSTDSYNMDELKNIMLSEINQSQKTAYCINIFKMCRIVKFIETKDILVVV